MKVDPKTEIEILISSLSLDGRGLACLPQAGVRVKNYPEGYPSPLSLFYTPSCKGRGVVRKKHSLNRDLGWKCFLQSARGIG